MIGAGDPPAKGLSTAGVARKNTRPAPQGSGQCRTS